MATARSPRSTWKYVLLADRTLPKEEQTGDAAQNAEKLRARQTVWKLKHLTIEEEHRLLDNLVRDPVSGMAVRATPGSEHLNSLRIGLTGWDNWLDENGNPIPCELDKRGRVPDELLFRIPLSDREELARAIENELAFDPDEVGKSSRQSD